MGNPYPFDITLTNQYYSDCSNIINYYHLPVQNVQYTSGFINISNDKIWLQYFRPSNPIGTIILLHGYLDHSANCGHIIKYLLSLNFQVYAYDLRGHGMSGGTRGAIHDFNEYSDDLDKIVQIVSNQGQLPLVFIGHSTGCAVLIEYLTHYHNPFMKILFLSPLVRIEMWAQAQIAYFFISSFIQEVPRLFSESSSDRDYLYFTQYLDPLQDKTAAVEWVTALIKWDKKIDWYTNFNTGLTIIQGTEDKVVDWKYNLPYLSNRFEKVDIKMITNARHHLYNEAGPIRAKVFIEISNFLVNLCRY